MMQSLIVAIYPLLKGEFHLSFVQIGAITLTYQACASLLQPIVGIYTDKHPQPYSLSAGMGFTLVGHRQPWALRRITPACWLAAALIGAGSVDFSSGVLAHRAPGLGRTPRSGAIDFSGRRQCRLRRGTRCSRRGSSCQRAQRSLAWFALAALLAMVVLARVGGWYKRQHIDRPKTAQAARAPLRCRIARVRWSIAVLVLLIFSKYFYVASIPSYYSFYLIEKFHTVGAARRKSTCSCFCWRCALGTLSGGPMGDRIGRKRVIWVSILGSRTVQPDAALRRFDVDRRS